MSKVRSVVATVFLVLAGVVPVGADAQDVPAVPPRDPRPSTDRPATASGVIRGRVVRASSGEPVRRVLIDVIAAGDGAPVRQALSGADGRYEVRNLPPGAYSIRASRNGFAPMDYGQRYPFQLARRTVTVDKVAENIDFALAPAGAVSGVVLDEGGEPISRAVVALARPGVVNGRRTLAVVSRSRPTNDLGEFRVGGLPEGEYIVAVAPRLDSFDDVEQEYAPTYYPGTNSLAEAQRVRVRFGAEVSGLVLPVTSMRTAAISGIVSGATQAGELMVRLSQRSFTGATSRSTPVENGAFRFTNVAPGDYTVETSRDTPAGSESAVAEVRVAGRDVSITLNLGAPPMFRGQIRFDPTPAALPPVPSVIVVSEAWVGGDRLRSSQARPRDDWSFEVPAVPGSPTTIRTRVPEGWAARSIRINGKDVVGPVQAESGLSGLEITLTDRLSTVRGVVLDAQGRMAVDATVLIMPDPRAATGAQPDVARTALVDPAGTFAIRDMLPGRYVAVALAYIEEGSETNREWLARVLPVTIPVSVTTQELRLDLRLARNP